MATFHVRGHRHTGGKPDLELVKPILDRAMPAFQEKLRELVTEEVYQTIVEGRWNKKHGPRFAYHRTWLQYAYGSSRARMASGGMRKGREEDPRKGWKPRAQAQNLDANSELDRLKFNFLISALERHAKAGPGGSALMGPGRSTARANMAQAGVYDVTSALEQVKQLRAQFNQNLGEGTPEERTKARRQYQKGVENFLYGANEHNKFFQESRLGQAYVRRAEIAAMRHQRNVKVLNPNASFTGQDLSDGQVRMMKKRAEKYADGFKKAMAGRAELPSVRPTGSFRWGFQTGTLAEAWKRAEATRKEMTDRYRISIGPQDNRDGRNPGAATLTQYLKRSIRRLGGNPDLLKGQTGHALARKALTRVKGQWASMGIRVRK